MPRMPSNIILNKLLLLPGVFLGITLGAHFSLASVDNWKINAFGRSYPFSGALDLQYKRSWLIWDQRFNSKAYQLNGKREEVSSDNVSKSPEIDKSEKKFQENAPQLQRHSEEKSSDESFKFGLWSAQIGLASHGTVDFTIRVNPISVFEVFGGAGMTERFYRLKKFDCEIENCQGLVSRSRGGLRALWGTDLDILGHRQIFMIPQWQRIFSHHSNNTQNLVDEQEMVLSSPGGESLDQTQLMVGINQDNEMVGLFFKRTDFARSHSFNQSEYLIYRKKDPQQKLWTLGLGRSQSSVFKPELSVIIGVSYEHGQELGLF